CALLSQDVVAIVGPRASLASEQVQAVCDRYLVPYFKMQWSYYDYAANSTFNMHPEYQVIGELVYDFLSMAKDWDKEIVIFYSNEESLAKFQYLFARHNGDFLIRRWVLGEQNADSNPFKFFRTKAKHMKWFIVDIPYREIKRFVERMAENQMSTTYFNYLFTDLDFPFAVPNIFAKIRANITGLSLVKFASPLTIQNLSFIEDYSYKFDESASHTRAALIHDSVNYITRVLLTLQADRKQSILPHKRSCSDPAGSKQENLSFLKALRSPDKSYGADYFTHHVEFTFGNSSRSSLNLTLLSNSGDKIEAVSYWIRSNEGSDAKRGLVLRSENELQRAARENIRGKTLRVTTMPEAPYVIYKPRDGVGSNSNDPLDWTGMCIEILRIISNKLHFNFRIQVVSDGQFGTPDSNDPYKWTGMIGELIEERADLALASLTITAERNKVIKFTTPYKNLGISILYRKPPKKDYIYLRFLEPFSKAVWGYVITAYIMVSFVLYFTARFTPYEWYNPHPCNQNSEIIENNFNMLNSLWFVIGSLMQQGIDIVPRATSTRIIAGCWWFFTLIIIASYTANLAAFLTVERMKPTIEKAEDLVEQSQIKYGTVKGGSTYRFFLQSSNEVFRKMYKQMVLNYNEVMQSKTEYGVHKVMNSTDYAFILESSTNDYWSKRNCELLKIGPNLDSKGYGFGLPKSSPYDAVISEEILGMMENQKMLDLEKTWFSEHEVKTPCSNQVPTAEDTSSLGFEQMSGCFMMVLIALFAALLISFCELSIRVYKLSKQSGRSIGQQMAREFRFSMSRKNKRNRRKEDNCVLPDNKLCCTAPLQQTPRIKKIPI
ncbi:Glutamate receptor ionotropic, kainate 1, partial [Cichlidogyrus casuarinus]